jgi:TonB-dependent receptor
MMTKHYTLKKRTLAESKRWPVVQVAALVALIYPFGLAGQGVTGSDEVATDEVFELDEYRVFSDAQDIALNLKRTSDRVGSFLSTDALGILPDDNLGDALTRLAGVNVVDNQVVIRGAEGKLNRIQVDGLAPSNVSSETTLNFGEADTRNFEVDQIPTDMIESVEVIKSVTADQDGDSVGGIVNVRLADAFNFQERVLRYKAEYRYKDLADSEGYRFSGTYADRLNKEGTMGLYLNFTYLDEDDMDSRLRVDYRESLPDLDEDGNPQNVRRVGRLRPGASAIGREEINLNGSFDWQVSESTVVSVKAWWSEMDELELDNEVRLDNVDESWLDYDRRNTVDAERWLDNLEIDPVTNELITVGNIVDNNEPGEFTPVAGDETDYYQSEEFRPIRLLNNRDSQETRYRLMLQGETKFENGGLLELAASYDRAEFTADTVNNSWEGEGQEYTRIFRAYVDQSDPLAPNLTAVLKDVPFGSGQDLDDNWGDPDQERIDGWLGKGYTQAEAEKMLAAGITGENAPNAVDADGSPVYWWEITDQGRVQVLDLINRMRFERDNELITFKGDYSQPISDIFNIKAGIKFTQEDRVTSADSKQWAQDFSVVEDVFGNALTYADFADLAVGFPAVTINDGLYSQASGDFINPILLEKFQNENFSDAAGRPLWQPVTPDSLRRIAAKNWTGEEVVSAAYVMGTLDLTQDLTLIAGMRYERTETDFTWKGSDVDPPLPFDPVSGELLGDVTLERATDIRAKKDYSNYLPSAIAVYRLNDHVFRLAYSRTVARPDFDDLNPLDINQLFQKWGEFFGDPDADIYIYNPELKEQTSDNLDLAWEWYYAEGSLFSVTLFRKKLKDFHLNQTVVRPDVPFPVLDDETGLQERDADGNLLFDFQDQDIKFAANGADRILEGVEISFQQSFEDLLPAPLDGFGILINYTYLEGTETNTLFDPEALLEGRFVPVGKVKSDGLSGQPEHILNTQLYWEKYGLNIRIAHNYVSEFDREVFSEDRDQIRASRSQWDASVQYFLPKKWTGGRTVRVFFEGRNLTEEFERDYDQIPRWTYYVSAPQREFAVGVRGEF